ncbi:MAG: hypothetical protein EXS17_08315 [Phycisphaerales bacterium]|nr:hypothetical protein [Phycisphaerales bacterium]
MSISRFTVGASALVLSVTSASHAAIVAAYSVGTGANTAAVQIDQEDGDGYLFNVAWDAAGYTSWDALLDIDLALSALSITFDTYSFGTFLTGVTIDGDTDYGTGDLWPIENYWHFWLRDSGAWEQAAFGADDRLLFNGASDGWTFGSSTAPQSVPAPGALVLSLFSVAVSRARRRSIRTSASQVK